MGESKRVHQEQQRRQEHRRRMIRNGAVVAAAFSALAAGAVHFAGGSSEEIPESLRDAQQAYFAKYGCPVADRVVVEYLPFGPQEMEQVPGYAGDAKVADIGGYTEHLGQNRIVLNSKFADGNEAEQRKAMLHELGHVCTDPQVRYFGRTLDIGQGIHIVGAYGFEVWSSDSTPEQPNGVGIIEEAAAEWLASDMEGYIPSRHPGYAAIKVLTDRLAQKAGLDYQEFSDLHEQGDLLGYTAALYRVTPEVVTGEQLKNLILVHQDTYRNQYVPDDQVLDSVYGIS